MLTLAGCKRAVRVHDLDGHSLDPLAGGRQVRAYVFVSTDCPVCNRYVPEIRALRARYAARGVSVRLVYPDATVTAGAVREHLRSYGLSPDALLDPRHALVHRAGVTITPEAAVFVGTQRVYRGRIDDRWAGFGRMRPAATRHELADALDAVLAGRTPPVAGGAAVGCAIADPL